MAFQTAGLNVNQHTQKTLLAAPWSSKSVEMFAISVFVTKIRIFIFFVEFIGVFSPNFYQIETRGKGENPLGLELLITLLIFSKKKFFTNNS